MRKRIIICVLTIITVAAFFAGCDALTFNSAENLVRPPRLSGEDGALQSSFEKIMSEKGEYILKYPQAGKYDSAFIRYDCDGDGEDEAFVFYSLKAEEMTVHMYMLDYVDGEWVPAETFPGEGNDVYAIDFSDLNNDGVCEIMVGWVSMDSKSNKKLSVYCADRSSASYGYRVLAIESYTNMHICDLDSDGEQEILLAHINATADTYTTEARLLKMVSDNTLGYQMTAVGQVSLYSEITAITAMTSGMSADKKYVYIDEAAENLYLTEMIYWDELKGTLATVFKVDMTTVAYCPTIRSLPLVCEDINSDGEIDIPCTQLMQNSSVVRKTEQAGSAVPAENIYVTMWKAFSDGDFITVSSYISNDYDGFRISYDETLMKNWCVTFYPDENTTQFFELRQTNNPENLIESVLMYTIKTVPADESVSTEKFIMNGKDVKYICEITEEAEKLGIDRTDVATAFSLIEYES